MAYSVDTSQMRKRSRPQESVKTQIPVWNQIDYRPDGVISNEYHIDYGRRPIPTSHFSDTMYDVVNKDFRKRKAAGEIFNNAMMHEIVEYNNPLSQCSGTLADANGNRSVVLASTIAPYQLYIPPKLTTPERLIDAAVTAAFAEVTSTEEDLLLWVGEMRESVDMFLSIGKTLVELLRKTKPQRVAYLKGKLTVKEAQSLTLALQYGILPLEEQLKSWQNGLLKLKKQGRNTARGFGRGDLTRSINEVYMHNQWDGHDVTGTETLSYNIRAGVLFDVESAIPGIAPYIDGRSIVTAVYALARLSFVVDWFINTGNTLASWSPTANTNILSSWVVVEEQWRVIANGKFRTLTGPSWKYDTRVSNLSFHYVRARKTRYPVAPLSRPILPDVNINLDINKIFSLILLFTKLR